MNNQYDVAIIGGGPAGLTAALYASRSKLKTLLIEKQKAGGQAATTEEIENWPGTKRVSGGELGSAMAEHAQKFGAEFVKDTIVALKLTDNVKEICGQEKKYQAKAVIIATGAYPRVLDIKGETEFRGKGVSYCATCDADFFEGLEVAVLGNGDAAIEEAIYLTKFAEKVHVIVIHDEGIVDAASIIYERAVANKKIKWIWNSTISEITGDGLVEKVVLKNIKKGEYQDLAVNGVFIFVGTVPATSLVENVLELDEKGYIKANPQDMSTILEGVYAAGDVRQKLLYQVVTAANDGAIAAFAAEKYLEDLSVYQNKILNNDKIVVVAFWSCKDQESIEFLTSLEQVIAPASEQVDLVKVDLGKGSAWAEKFKVEAVPTVIVLENGAQKLKLMGSQIPADFLDYLTPSGKEIYHD